jgi:hypothetical protein
MAWRKLGQVFDLQKQKIDWLRSHAMLPTPLLLEDRIRVYFTGRDARGHSRISFVDLSREDPAKILHVHDRPLLDVGKIGAFDDSGTLGACAIRSGETVFLYYNGYNRRVTVPWSNAVGLALSEDGGVTFQRMFEGPIVDRNPWEPYFAISPCILREAAAWHMWYTSGTGWVSVKDVPEPLYVVKYARSEDGITWRRDNATCISPSTPEEANARAAVVREGPRYKMWFCYRGSQDFRDGRDGYRIGYAEADDPVHWARDDARAGIRCAEEGWDASMQAYPAVVTVGGTKYLFYNGNGFGAAGFGCAVWD